MAAIQDEESTARMARATTGGRFRVGGQRRSCHRLLPALLLLAVLVPGQAEAASSDAEAWRAAREVYSSRSAAIAAAVAAFGEDGDVGALHELRRQVALAVIAMDGLDVRACFRVWWSYARTGYVLYDQALIGLQASDLVRIQSSTAAAAYLASMAAATRVVCGGTDRTRSSSSSPGRRGGLPLVSAVGA
jgi:hypothetical protein